ncbi:hypothetical protein MYXO_01241 [Myxococcaceae bacterium]|nr:hypothetical protein MYXO_01241 [Myxococcaceae bacterium]
MHVSYVKGPQGYLTGILIEDPDGEPDPFFVRAAVVGATRAGFTQGAILPAYMVMQRNAHRLTQEGDRVSITFLTEDQANRLPSLALSSILSRLDSHPSTWTTYRLRNLLCDLWFPETWEKRDTGDQVLIWPPFAKEIPDQKGQHCLSPGFVFFAGGFDETHSAETFVKRWHEGRHDSGAYFALVAAERLVIRGHPACLATISFDRAGVRFGAFQLMQASLQRFWYIDVSGTEEDLSRHQDELLEVLANLATYDNEAAFDQAELAQVSTPRANLEVELYQRIRTIFHGEERVIRAWITKASQHLPERTIIEQYEWIIDAFLKDNR